MPTWYRRRRRLYTKWGSKLRESLPFCPNYFFHLQFYILKRLKEKPEERCSSIEFVDQNLSVRVKVSWNGGKTFGFQATACLKIWKILKNFWYLDEPDDDRGPKSLFNESVLQKQEESLTVSNFQLSVAYSSSDFDASCCQALHPNLKFLYQNLSCESLNPSCSMKVRPQKWSFDEVQRPYFLDCILSVYNKLDSHPLIMRCSANQFLRCI